jgi:hypothetical protein
MAAVSAINPIAGYTIKGVQAVYGLLGLTRDPFSGRHRSAVADCASIHAEAETGVAWMAEFDR